MINPGEKTVIAGTEAALADWQLAEEITPENSWLHYFRASYFLDVGESEDAVRAFRRALASSSPPLNLPKRERALEALRGLSAQ